ncbi:MAG: sugar ABC transporter ATP-binding protein [Lachnospiraceae bacterium]|nr:sugar ABC transporter ATP-binding protein [Lachnospiraceae bacterium]
MASECILEIKNIKKSFPGVKALDNVTINLKRGEIHALVGENGAGKSTLMKILAGIYTPDEGEMLFDGKPFVPKKPVDALDKGISMVHQELDLVPEMTVEENVFSGREKKKGIMVDKRGMQKRTQDLMDELGIHLDPKDKIKNLSTAEQQMVAIIRAIAFDAEVIIMDEPTSAITDREVAKLFEIIEKLKGKNKSIVYISHKMDEIYSLTDEITVLRDGQLIGSVHTKDVTPDELIHMMVGRELNAVFIKDAPKSATYDENEVVLKVENLTRANEFYNINFEVKRGEILGIFGLMGAGRTETMETIFGLRKADSGTVTMRGDKIHGVKAAIRKGIAFVTEDRKLFGLNLIGSVKDNITIAYLKQVLKGGFLMDFKKEKATSDELIERLKIKCASRDTLAGTLSGGNQQKIVLAKWFMGDPDLLIMDEPTRGIDVGAKAEIYKLMDTLVKEGKSIIMISSETPELLGMSDRIIVMHEGFITGEASKNELTQEELMAYAIGETEKAKA